MDFPRLRAQLEGKLSDIAGFDAQPLLGRFDAFRAEYLAPATTDVRKAEIAQELRLLIGDTADRAHRIGGVRAWSIIGCMAGAVVACFALVFWFFTPFSAQAIQSRTKISEFLTATSIVMVVCFGSAIICYRLLAGGVARRPGPGGGMFSGPTMPFATLVTILFFGGVALYMNALEGDISSVRATRPILVFTLIVAMLGFGGLLMVRSLFGNMDHEQLEKRFRLAREIFLVYSGIFGTIIGFYFGAADEPEAGMPPSISLAGSRGTISAQVSGGSPPFTGVLQRTDPPLDLVLAGSGRLLAVQLPAGKGGRDGDRDGDGVPDYCGLGGTVTVIDGRGRRASADVAGDLFSEKADPCAAPSSQKAGSGTAAVPRPEPPSPAEGAGDTGGV